MPSKAELEKKVKNLQDLNPEPGSDEYNLLQKYKKELAGLSGGSKTAASSAAADGTDFALGEDDWNAAKSKFARKGLHLSEFQVPEWANVGKSIKLPFTIVDGSADDGLESAIYTGVSAASAGILKRYIQNLGIEPDFPITLTKLRKWVPGKRAMTLWTEEMDKRPPEEGGKGRLFTKPTDIQPVGASEPEELA